MNRQTTRISPADVDRQRDFCQKLHERFAARPSAPLAFVDTYGCQQNEADSERLRGYLSEMGYQFTQSEAEADLIVINTCAIREHAEMRVLGNVGALVHTKRSPVVPDTLLNTSLSFCLRIWWTTMTARECLSANSLI